MAPYKKQHFLPLAYLGHFGRPHDTPLRQRKIWRVSETHAGEVPVGTQCQEDYFYSKDRARLCESYFGGIESVYARQMAAIGRGETLTHEAMFNFFLCAVDFYARGCKFRVSEEKEEFAFYLKRMEIFKKRLISDDLLDARDEARRAYLLKEWDFAIIPFPDTAVLTSDSPSIWFSSSSSGDQLRGVLMPLTPRGCFVGAHRSSYRIIRKAATNDDALVVTRNEIENCVDAVYFSDALDETEITTIRTQLAKRAIPVPISHGWQFELIDYDKNPNLSFVAPAPRTALRQSDKPA